MGLGPDNYIFQESTDSSSNSTTHLQLPPGFRFHPTDEELVVHYLLRKVSSSPLPASIIADIELYKFDPWELPSKAVFGEKEWYFFTPRERKYPNGVRPNRAATSGYWKATGTDKPIMSRSSCTHGNQKVGVKKALVFYNGKPPKGVKTNWIMHEFRLIHHGSSSYYSNSNPPPVDHSLPTNRKLKPSLKLDDWVLCRIYMKSSTQISTSMEHEMEKYSRMEAAAAARVMSCTDERGVVGAESKSKQPKLVVAAVKMDNCFLERVVSNGGGNNVNCNNNDNVVIHQNGEFPSSSGSYRGSHSHGRSLPCQLWNDASRSTRGGTSLGVDLLNSQSRVSSGSTEENISLISLVNVNKLAEQNAPFQPSGLPLGSLCDGVLRQQFQLHNMNWDS